MKNYLSILFCLLFITVQGQETKNDFNTKSISVFKNSSAFFIKEGTVNTKNGVYKMTNHFPTALFGTLWIHSPEGHLQHISSFQDEVNKKQTTPATSIPMMIRLNQGKKMKIWLSDEESHEGIVEAIDSSKMTNPGSPTISLQAQHIVTFKTGDQWLTIPMALIKRVSFMEKPEQLYSSEIKEKKNILQVDFSNKKKKQRLDMMYLSGGMNWTPMYLMELTSDTRAKLTLRSELKNNIEDIKNTDINFVVGVPNFLYANRPIALIDFMTNIPVIQQGNFQNFSNIRQTQSLNYGIEATSASGISSNAIGGVEGEVNEDLFFYSLKNVSLKKGGKAHYQLFKDEIDIAHIYEVNIQQNQENKGYYQKEFLFSEDNQNRVIHSVKLENSTPYPWTTGSIMVVNTEGTTKPVSQDLLKYTSIKVNTFVKLTEAPDVRVKHAEKEISRELRVKKHHTNKNYYFDYVTVEGEIKIKNYKAKDIDLNIRRTIVGELLDTSTEWLKAERVNRSASYNRITDVCWETSLGAGKELVIKYQYKVYVPS